MKMDKITTEFAEYICDMCCGNLEDVSDQDEAYEICTDCKLGQFICDILNEYNRINDFDKSQSKIMLEKLSKYQNMDCTGCIHKGNKSFCLNCKRGGCRDYYLKEEK